MTVRDIAGAVAAGDLTPDDVIEATLSRIGQLEPLVQAFTLLDAEGAREQARVLTAEAKAGELRGPLHGVPVAIKDEFHIKGMPTAMRGLDNPPLEPEDATCVARLRAAGAIIVGKTTMPIEGVMPPTRNPWNLEHTAGGTSSGSGAAVGARMVPFAIGEQTAGSNLRPAAYNGVAGLKPTYGRISRFGCYPFTWSRDHVGLIGLTMADLALVLSVIAGPDERDPTTIQEAPPPADLKLDEFAPPRIGVVRNFYPERTEPIMQEAIESAAARFAAAGATVSDFLLPQQFGLSWHAANLVGAEGAVFNLGQQMLQGAGGRPPQRRAAELIPATYYVQARRIRTWLTGVIRDMMAGIDALLMAVAPGAAPKGLTSTGDASLLVPWSFLGFPAITVNAGLSPEGLPLGIQLVATPRADWDLLRTGAWAEEVLGRLPAPAIV
jgi:aspartyl-tRNA(Asn)/glutamyl-tRNA(Gln) amidotransferase subunit A